MGQSWSGIKKRLEEEFLAESLRGRVKYFITKYHKAHDDEARFAIIFDEKEILHANVFDFYRECNRETLVRKKELNIKGREWNGKEFINSYENELVENQVEKELLDKGIFPVYSFTDSVFEFLNQNIDESLNSENPLIRILAVFDRRIGKRKLGRLKDTYLDEPEWVQEFYKIRMKAENLL